MRYDNNPNLKQTLSDGGFPWMSQAACFEVDDLLFAERLYDLQNHVNGSTQQQLQDRAAYQCLTLGRPPENAVVEHIRGEKYVPHMVTLRPSDDKERMQALTQTAVAIKKVVSICGENLAELAELKGRIVEQGIDLKATLNLEMGESAKQIVSAVTLADSRQSTRSLETSSMLQSIRADAIVRDFADQKRQKWLWIWRIAILLAIILIAALHGHAQAVGTTYVRGIKLGATDATSVTITPTCIADHNCIDANVLNVPHVICDSGCSSSAGFSDNSTFTVGTTAINVIGGYYTSGAAPTLSSGNAGRLRMDANSYLFTDCVVGCSGGATTPADGFANPTTAGLDFSLLGGFNGTTWDRLRDDSNKYLYVDVANTSIAVTGTFWQATQPVSGTFWQATQPVSGTFWQATQPISGAISFTAPQHVILDSGTTVVTQGTGTNLHTVVDSGSVTVSGSVTAACSTACEVSPTTAANTVSNPFFNTLTDNAGHANTYNSTTTSSKYGADTNILSILGTAPTTAGFIDIKGADGNVFVRQTTGSNLHVQADSGSTTAVTGVVEVAPTGSANTLSNQFFTQITNGTTGASVTASGASPASTVGALVTTPSPNGTGCAGQSLANTSSVAINTASASEVQLVAGSGSTLIYVCHYDFIATTAVTVTLQQASSATCATLTAMTGPYPAAANGGISAGDGAHVLFKIAAGDQLCLLLGSGVQTSGLVTYAQVNAP